MYGIYSLVLELILSGLFHFLQMLLPIYVLETFHWLCFLTALELLLFLKLETALALLHWSSYLSSSILNHALVLIANLFQRPQLVHALILALLIQFFLPVLKLFSLRFGLRLFLIKLHYFTLRHFFFPTLSNLETLLQRQLLQLLHLLLLGLVSCLLLPQLNLSFFLFSQLLLHSGFLFLFEVALSDLVLFEAQLLWLIRLSP